MDAKTWIELGELALKACAAVAAGAWAVALLYLLRQREQVDAKLRTSEATLRMKEAQIRDLELTTKQALLDADARLRKTEVEIQDITLKMKQQAVVTVEIEPTVIPSPDRKGYIIIAVVEITNRGSRMTKIKWKDEPPAFYVRSVQFHEKGEPKHGEIVELEVRQTVDPDAEALSHVVRAGSKEVIPFAARVSTRGLYLLSFRGAVDAEEREEAKKLDVKMPTAWTGNKYVLVGDASVEADDWKLSVLEPPAKAEQPQT